VQLRDASLAYAHVISTRGARVTGQFNSQSPPLPQGAGFFYIWKLKLIAGHARFARFWQLKSPNLAKSPLLLVGTYTSNMPDPDNSLIPISLYLLLISYY
jgi:hypothetical protein